MINDQYITLKKSYISQKILDNFQLFLDFLSLLHLLCIPLVQSLYLLLQLLDPPGRLTAAAALSPLSVRGSAAGSLRTVAGRTYGMHSIIFKKPIDSLEP